MEVRRVLADLPLGHAALLLLVDELDGVLDRDDVALSGPVDVSDQGRDRRALAAPGGAGHEHQPPVVFAERPNRLRQAQLLEGQVPAQHRAGDDRDATLVAGEVQPEAPPVLEAEATVEVPLLVEPQPPVVGEGEVQQLLDLFCRGRLHLQPADAAVDPKGRDLVL